MTEHQNTTLSQLVLRTGFGATNVKTGCNGLLDYARQKIQKNLL